MNGSVDSPQPLWIGRGATNGYFKGIIDDPLIWRKAASDGEIANDYNHDSDGNGLPDTWEFKYFGSIGQNRDALAPRGDGLTLLQSYWSGYNPIDFYNGALPSLSFVGGTSQFGSAGTTLPIPLSVQVNGGQANAPVTFSIQSGNARLSLNGSTPSTSVQTRSTASFTDDQGHSHTVAQVSIVLPTNNLDNSIITASATSGEPFSSVTTSISTTARTASVNSRLLPPTNVQAVAISATRTRLSWTPSDSTQPVSIQSSQDNMRTWTWLQVVPSGQSEVILTGIQPDHLIYYRIYTGDYTSN